MLLYLQYFLKSMQNINILCWHLSTGKVYFLVTFIFNIDNIICARKVTIIMLVGFYILANTWPCRHQYKMFIFCIDSEEYCIYIFKNVITRNAWCEIIDIDTFRQFFCIMYSYFLWNNLITNLSLSLCNYIYKLNDIIIVYF